VDKGSVSPVRGFVALILVLGGLFALVMTFPKQGIPVYGEFKLKFPSLNHLIYGDSLSYADLERLRQQQYEDSVLLSKLTGLSDSLNLFLRIGREAPHGFIYPDATDTLFFPVFRKWERMPDSATFCRIMHYGDSQIEIDRISGKVREGLQQKFGGGGPGLQPALQMIPSGTVRQSYEGAMQRFAIWGFDSIKPGHSRYGPMLNFCRVESDTLKLSFQHGYSILPEAGNIHRVKLLAGYAEQDVTIHLYGSGRNLGSRTLPAGNSWRSFSWESEVALSSLSFTLTGGGGAYEIYGVSLEHSNGITLDNLPMRGCSGTIFTGVNREQLRWGLEELEVDWLWLQFGGNSMPQIKSKADAERYAENFGRQLQRFKELVPDVPILVIGPSDMSRNIEGKWRTWPFLPETRDALKKVSLREGAAFFDLMRAMGGKNSMPSWVNATPPLAGADYIHFTARGADKVADMLLETLLREFEIYKLKQRKSAWDTLPALQ
jgi:lysophospholipase L1-like esterase